jgi:hypothetical protein
MRVTRRRLFGTIAVGGLQPVSLSGQPPVVDVSSLGVVSDAHGVPLSPARLRVIAPAWQSRSGQRASLRSFAVEERVEPTQGIQVK